MMQASTVIDSPSIENIPEQLTERPQWVCWRLEERDGKNTKVPYTPGTIRRASTTDLEDLPGGRGGLQALRATI